MFRDFSFEAASRPASIPERDRAMNVSPTHLLSQPEPRTSNQPSWTSISELSDRLSEHTIHCDSRYSMQQYSAPAYTYPEHYTLEPKPIIVDEPEPSYDFEASSRSRRRHAVCDPAEMKDIVGLLERMVQNGEQCCLRASTATSSEAEDDEPISVVHKSRRSSTSVIPSHGLKYRRSGERLSSGAVVARNVRIRKKRHRKSGSGTDSR